MKPLQAFDAFKGHASKRPVDAWFAVTLMGVALAAASYYVGVGIVHFHGQLLNGRSVAGYALEKEVGYFAALNWSLGGAVLAPALVACSLSMHAAMEPALRSLAGRSMARTKGGFEIITAEQLVARWKHDRALGLFIPFLSGVLVFAFILMGWVTEVALPSLRGITSPDFLTIGSAAEEYDWSIACLMNNGQHVAGGCSGSLAFSLVAYLLIPGLITAYAFSCVIDATRFVAFACGATNSPEVADSKGSPLPADWILVASPAQADDPRCGFGAFEPFLSAFLGTVCFIMLTLFLIITQNAYLRDPNSRNILDFFLQDLSTAASSLGSLQGNHGDIASTFSLLLKSDKGINLFNPKTIFGIFTFFFIVVLSVSAVVTLILRAAARAREAAIDHIAQLSTETGLAEKELYARLIHMKFWPLSWISQNTAIATIVFISLALLSFRLALLPSAIGAAIIVAAGLRQHAARRKLAASKQLQRAQANAYKYADIESPLRVDTAQPRGFRPPHLLISYRRSDSEAITGRIRDRLAAHFGENAIFMDIDSIPFGLDFREQIGLAVGRTDIVLAIIGPDWRGEGTEGAPRVLDEGDPVRFEIETALQKSIPIIPVLVQGAKMPDERDLPSSLRDFHFRNAVTVDSGRDFHPHLDRLIRAMEFSLESRGPPASPAQALT
jgi:hypothetical protein